ncbi:uncharacterized protein B0P05DRAFT_621798 [Gilbertella persicaria]|nr:uncharacterized protein B0P05DRAFT_621798 [Gilbertella persicaria]KAI8065379.1 hypothetical protein B0P05DRAFT_621798 [Gilbertella persicaria]
MKEFNLAELLPQQAVSNILKKADGLYKNVNAVKNSKSSTRPCYPKLDKHVRNCTEDMDSNSLLVNRQSILKYARQLDLSNYRVLESEITFSDG